MQSRTLSRLDRLAEVDSGHLCSECPEGEHCLPLGLSQVERQQLDGIMRVSRTVPARQALFRAGDAFAALYAVRSGVFKTVSLDSEGGERVVGFHLPGELMGMDGVYSGRHQCEAVAVRAGRVCRFPYSDLTELASSIPSLMERLLQLFSKDIVGNLAGSSDCLAEERLAAFLLRMAWRVSPRGQLNEHITLPMSRADMANHLGVAGATLSRLLGRLQDEGMIGLQRQQLHLRNPVALRGLARRLSAVAT